MRNIVKSANKTSYILLSENLILMCIGIAFTYRAIYFLNPGNLNTAEMELKMAEFKSDGVFQCGISSLLLSYGPLVVSLVNSFLGLIIDNYLHYRMLRDIEKKEQEDIVQEIGETSRSLTNFKLRKFNMFWKKYYSYITIVSQWIIPILITLFMYPMQVKEMSMHEVRSLEDSCMATLQMSNTNCNKYIDFDNITVELRKNLISPTNYLEVLQRINHNNKTSTEIDSVLSNIFSIVKNFNNHTDFQYTNMTKSLRQPKFDDKCMKMCFTDNKNMLVYMFVLAIVSYFVPITISMMILTKIHIMDVKRPNAKTYITRELLYNVLFWTPVMFDTFLSLIMCSFTMHGTRTSLLNAVANVYQAIRNFMQTRYFTENAIVPV